jgi:hypothetical protein
VTPESQVADGGDLEEKSAAKKRKDVPDKLRRKIVRVILEAQKYGNYVESDDICDAIRDVYHPK